MQEDPPKNEVRKKVNPRGINRVLSDLEDMRHFSDSSETQARFSAGLASFKRSGDFPAREMVSNSRISQSFVMDFVREAQDTIKLFKMEFKPSDLIPEDEHVWNLYRSGDLTRSEYEAYLKSTKTETEQKQSARIVFRGFLINKLVGWYNPDQDHGLNLKEWRKQNEAASKAAGQS